MALFEVFPTADRDRNPPIDGAQAHRSAEPLHNLDLSRLGRVVA